MGRWVGEWMGECIGGKIGEWVLGMGNWLDR